MNASVYDLPDGELPPKPAPSAFEPPPFIPPVDAFDAHAASDADAASLPPVDNSFDPAEFAAPPFFGSAYNPAPFDGTAQPIPDPGPAALSLPIDDSIPVFDSGVFDAPAFTPPAFESAPQSPSTWQQPVVEAVAQAVEASADLLSRRARRQRDLAESAGLADTPPRPEAETEVLTTSSSPTTAASPTVAPSVEAESSTGRMSYRMPDFTASSAPMFTLTPSPYDEVLDLGAGTVGSDPDLIAALNMVVALRGSDLHVSVNAAPMLRIDGALDAVPGLDEWDTAKVIFALHSIMSPAQLAQFEEELELDFAYTLSESSRFRVNIYQQRGAMGAAFRLIPTEIKQLDTLGIPDKIGKFAQLPRGLVLVTGPTGSGKSTTLAALIDLVNATRADHIVTVEDPIEFMHQNKKSLVNQREVGHDTHSFANALKHVLRQDPDVILIGELRDLETISVALTAAETGHLVFATLHTQNAPQTVDRIIDVFPPHQQGQVRAQLAATLQGVVCQTLVKRIGGGRAVATEVLVASPAVSNLIREGKTYQIHSVMQAGRDLGMHTMDQHLAELVNANLITHQAAADKAQDLEDLKQLIKRAGDIEHGQPDAPSNGIYSPEEY
jgi:twitching motility protein PilT